MNRTRRVQVSAILAAATIGLLGACAPGSTPDPAASDTQATPAPTSGQNPSSPAAGPGGVTEAQAADLCSRIEGQLQNWRTYTPSMSKPGLNILVGEWAAANQVDLIALAGDRARVDTITSQQCADVRQEAITALEIPDLAAALVGF
jgi:hypothetical protein